MNQSDEDSDVSEEAVTNTRKRGGEKKKAEREIRMKEVILHKFLFVIVDHTLFIGDAQVGQCFARNP